MTKTWSEIAKVARKKFFVPLTNDVTGFSLELAYAAVIIAAGVLISAAFFVLR